MPKIVETIEINSSLDRLWEVISDVDDEAEYWWGTRKVRNISKDGNVINREIYQNFGNHPILQKVILKPQSEIETQYIKGITEGIKYLKVDPLNGNQQKLTVDWNIRFTGIYWLLTPFIIGHVRKGTREALSRIKDASEGGPIQRREQITKKN